MKSKISQLAKLLTFLYLFLLAPTAIHAADGDYQMSLGRKVYSIDHLASKTPTSIANFLHSKYTANGEYKEITNPTYDKLLTLVEYKNRVAGSNAEPEMYQFWLDLDGKKHIVHLNARIELDKGRYDWAMTNTNSEADIGFNMVGDAFNFYYPEDWRSLNPSSSGVRYYEKVMPETPYHKATREIRKVFYYTNTYTSGVIEMRLIPDDYVGTIHTDYIYYHGGSVNKNLTMNTLIDSQMNDPYSNYNHLAVYRSITGNGMYTEYQFVPGKRQRFSYGVPRIRDRQEIQYIPQFIMYLTGAQAPNSSFYDFFIKPSPTAAKQSGTGVESGAYNNYTVGTTPDVINVAPGKIAYKQEWSESAIAFKDKGQLYKPGMISIYTINQGINNYIAPELMFSSGFYEFDLGDDGRSDGSFDLAATSLGMQWFDPNNSSDVGTIYSKGGELYLDGELVAKYTKRNGVDVGTFTPEKEKSLLIDETKLRGNKNTFEYIIKNNINLESRGEIAIYKSPIVNVSFVDQMGRTLTPPTGGDYADVKTSYKDRVGNPLKIVFPKAIDGKNYSSVTPTSLPAHTNYNTSTYQINTLFPSDWSEAKFVYKASSISALTIKFVLASNSKEMVRKDFTLFDNPNQYVESITVDATTGESIDGILNYLISSNQIKLKYPGYKPLSVDAYKYDGGNSKPTVVDKPMTIY